MLCTYVFVLFVLNWPQHNNVYPGSCSSFEIDSMDKLGVELRYIDIVLQHIADLKRISLTYTYAGHAVSGTVIPKSSKRSSYKK